MTTERRTSGAGLQSIRDRLKQDDQLANASPAGDPSPALPTLIAEALISARRVDAGGGRLLRVGVCDQAAKIASIFKLAGFQQLQEFQRVLEKSGYAPRDLPDETRSGLGCDFVFAPTPTARPNRTGVKLHTRKVKDVAADEADELVLRALNEAAECSPDTSEAILVGVCNESGKVYRTAVLMSGEQQVRASSGLRQLGYHEVRSLGLELPEGFDVVFVRS